MSSNASTNSSAVLWIHDFTLEGFQQYYDRFVELENDDGILVIPIIIASYGGETVVELGLRDLIKSSTKPVTTIALGSAMSAGACLLAAGTPGFRFAAPNTQIMIHEVSAGVIGKCADIKNEAVWVDRMNKQMLAFLAEDSGKSVEFFDEKMTKNKNADLIITAKEAKAWNLIDHIGIPRFYPEPAYYNMVIPGQQEMIKDILAVCGKKKKSSKNTKKKPPSTSLTRKRTSRKP